MTDGSDSGSRAPGAMALVPAVMHLLGRAAWWLPRPVDRVLPDIEGERLQREPVELVKT
ncbi:hypothetical protein AB0D13_28200 [Streptomyces sp. NPDC048430]|uniref:hypothetical protein n=1 Tax=unclassified Streptomyces TaxID=2593676 RepID=UPI003418DB8D